MCIPGTGSQWTRGKIQLKIRAPTTVETNAAARSTVKNFDCITFPIISSSAEMFGLLAVSPSVSDEFNHGYDRPDDCYGKESNTNVFHGVRLQPSDDLPAIKVRQ